MEFRERLRELRGENEMTQTDIAKILNVSKMAISHWEKGHSEPSITQLKQMAKLFGVSIDYLVGYSDM